MVTLDLLGAIKAKISSLSLNVDPSQTINLFLEMDVQIITRSYWNNPSLCKLSPLLENKIFKEIELSNTIAKFYKYSTKMKFI